MGVFCKRKIILVFCGVTVMIFFLSPVNAANAKTVLSPAEIIFNAPVVKTLSKFYSQNLPIKDLVLGAGVECGGGDQTKIGLGPVLENIESCDVCKNIAQCLTNKYGVGGAGVGYLWDSVTKRCGLGIEISKAEAESCQEEEDPCLGVDSARFAEIKDDVLGAVDAVKNLKNRVTFNPYFEADDVAPAELLLALMWVESKWDTLYGNTTYNTNLPFSCSDEETAMNEMCSDINFGLKTVDKHGKECEEMPISNDPDGAGPICDGKMGISQILPSIYVPKTFFGGTNQCVAECGAAGGELTTCVGICQSKNLIGEVTDELYPDPWNQHDGIYMAETILTLRHANFDGPECIADCVAKGRTVETCLSECRIKKERCAIIDYHFGAGTCQTAGAVEDAFVDEVRTYKPVMKNLLDTGNCEGGAPPGPGGPIPTPCPPENLGAAVLKNYISNTFNIHFQGPWTAGGLYDVCQKLYETSGTRFDDFFVNDPNGATVATDGGGGFCSVFGRRISCDPNMALIGSRGEIFTLVMFHELGHTLKAMNPAAAREADIGATARFEYNLHIGETTTPWLFDNTRHISKYPYGVHSGICPILTIWDTEEYAETVGYYFHHGTGEIQPIAACMGGAMVKPFVNANHKAPEHCNLMYDVMGAYNPSCAETLGIWEIHSPACDASDAGSCLATIMLQFFDMHAADAVQICRRESGGNALALNDGCLTGTSFDYSVGLFQINLLAHCGDEDGDGITPFSLNNPFCTITDQDDVDICMKKFGYGDPMTNASRAVSIASGGSNWCPWSAAGPSHCALCPHP